MKGIIKQFIKKACKRIDKNEVVNRDFVIVSNNCWGAEIYKWLDREYNTPFVGLYLFGPCYIQLLTNFQETIKKEICFTYRSKYFELKSTYPIGLIDDIEIHFMHYKTELEAIDKWKRRLRRMLEVSNLDNYYFKICDRAEVDIEILEKFHSLPFKNKISFGIKEMPATPNHLCISENENNKSVIDGIGLYKVSFKYVDLIYWLKKQKIKKTINSKIKAFANIN